jgi:hypothetical protein
MAAAGARYVAGRTLLIDAHQSPSLGIGGISRIFVIQYCKAPY